jgi:hypothetical protein
MIDPWDYKNNFELIEGENIIKGPSDIYSNRHLLQFNYRIESEYKILNTKNSTDDYNSLQIKFLEKEAIIENISKSDIYRGSEFLLLGLQIIYRLKYKKCSLEDLTYFVCDRKFNFFSNQTILVEKKQQILSKLIYLFRFENTFYMSFNFKPKISVEEYNKLNEIGRFWAKDVYIDKDFIFEYSAASYATFLDKNPNLNLHLYLLILMGDQQKIQSAILKLETLKTQFSLAMNQYKTASSNYQTSRTPANLAQVNSLNSKLINLHAQILQTLKEVNPSYQSVSNATEIQGKNLFNVNENLTREKRKINALLAEYNTLEHLQTDTSLKVESNYSYYKILIIISIIVIFFIIKQLVSFSLSDSQMRGGGKTHFYNLLIKPMKSLIRQFRS